MGSTVLEHRVISSSSLLSPMETQEWRRQQCFSGVEAMPGLTHQGMLQGWNTPGLGSVIPASSVQRKGVQAWQLSRGALVLHSHHHLLALLLSTAGHRRSFSTYSPLFHETVID